MPSFTPAGSACVTVASGTKNTIVSFLVLVPSKASATITCEPAVVMVGLAEILVVPAMV